MERVRDANLELQVCKRSIGEAHNTCYWSRYRRPLDSVYRPGAVFEASGGQWVLKALSAARQGPTTSSVEIREVNLVLAGVSVRHKAEPVPIINLLKGLPGEHVAVALVANTASASAYAYLGGNRRQLLPYAGTDSRGARFEGTIPFPGQQGLGQIGFDLVASATLEVPAGLYDASIWGVPVIRKGGAL